ncbi:MAG: hypothetical protein HXX08_12225 [Chloroflexi bacterium]|uniref:Uncharacterized protein n=1 Tax=Candidatus Chlorohelix allophototropha TaxID=3003348 RepID=A0A8T7LXD7_9CHLR|nr:hypothetical protein [Chloroflexota bacterium]WJW66008.1 hypothetical protein OZ401_001790 [Chloroflexota bacterium L227-S17]
MSEYYQIKGYIRHNRNTYTREAITEELLKRGYSQSDIDDAWKSLLEEEHILENASKESVTESGKFWWAFAAYFFILPVIIGILARIVREKSYYIMSNNSFNVFLIGGVITILSGIILSLIFWDSDKPLSRGVFYGCLFTTVTPVISLGVIIGICSAG